MNKQVVIGSIILLIFLISSGCQARKSNIVEKEAIVGKLKILAPDEYDFMRDFGKLFRINYPNVILEFVTPQSESGMLQSGSAISEYISREKPDIVLLDQAEYHELSKMGKLLNLQPYISADKDFDIHQFVGPVVELLKSNGEGNINGLAPFFHSRILYFNKDLFDKYEIEEPANNMTWDQVFEIANLFSRKASSTIGEYGLFHPVDTARPNPFWLLNIAAQSEATKLYNLEKHHAEFADTRYEELYKIIVQGFQNKSIYWPTGDESDDLFLSGKSAMRYEGYFYLDSLDGVDFQWSAVSEPARDGKTAYTIQDIFSIPIQSNNQDLAWTFIKFVNSERFLQIKQRTNIRYGIPSFIPLLDKDKNSTVYRAFFQLKPRVDVTELTAFSNHGFNEEAIQVTIRAIHGEVSLEDAVDQVDKQLRME